MIPFSVPLLGGGAGRGPIAVHEVLTGTGTGSMDIIVPGVAWTPAAAILVVSSKLDLLDGNTPYAQGSYGFTAGGNMRCSSWVTHNDTSTFNHRRTASTRIAQVLGTNGAPFFEATHTAFIPGGWRININTNSLSFNVRLSIVLFSSLAVPNAAVGHFSGTGSINLGFQPSVIFTTSAYNLPFDNTLNSTGTAGYRGFVSYDGTTTRQGGVYFGTYDGSPRQSEGTTSGEGGQGHTFTGTATGFSVVASDANVRTGYLALRGVDGWVGNGSTPTATGIASFPAAGGPSWTPNAAMLYQTSATAAGVMQTAGFSHGIAVADPIDEFSASWAPQDNSATPVDYSAAYDDIMGALAVSGGGRLFAGRLSQFKAGAADINYSAVDASARHFVGMLMRAA